MKIFILTSANFSGEMEFRFDAGGSLEYFERRAELTAAQELWLMNNFPFSVSHLKQLAERSSNANLVEIKRDVTFDMFWNRYDEKALSSKKKAAQRWNNMTKSNKVGAFNYIYTYVASLPPGVRKKYAETYLSSEIWNN